MVTATMKKKKKTTKTDAESYYKSLALKVYRFGANDTGLQQPDKSKQMNKNKKRASSCNGNALLIYVRIENHQKLVVHLSVFAALHAHATTSCSAW